MLLDFTFITMMHTKEVYRLRKFVKQSFFGVQNFYQLLLLCSMNFTIAMQVSLLG